MRSPPHPELFRTLWDEFHKKHGCSADKMICTPVLRAKFLVEWRVRFGPEREEKILLGLLKLRKQKPKGLPGLKVKGDSGEVASK